MEVHHVAQTAVRESRAENGDVVLVRPVVNGSFVIDLLAQSCDDLARGPV